MSHDVCPHATACRADGWWCGADCAQQPVGTAAIISSPGSEPSPGIAAGGAGAQCGGTGGSAADAAARVGASRPASMLPAGFLAEEPDGWRRYATERETSALQVIERQRREILLLLQKLVRAMRGEAAGPDALHVAAVDLARSQADEIDKLRSEVERLKDKTGKPFGAGGRPSSSSGLIVPAAAPADEPAWLQFASSIERAYDISQRASIAPAADDTEGGAE